MKFQATKTVTSDYKTSSSILYESRTLQAKLKIMFCLCSTVVVLCELSSKKGLKFYYGSIVHIVSIVSEQVKHTFILLISAPFKRVRPVGILCFVP